MCRRLQKYDIYLPWGCSNVAELAPLSLEKVENYIVLVHQLSNHVKGLLDQLQGEVSVEALEARWSLLRTHFESLLLAMWPY